MNILSEAKPDTILHHQILLPPPVKVNGKDYWVMEKYVDTCWFRNYFQFKIHWVNFAEEHDTWENTDNIDSDNRPCMLEDGDNNLDLEEEFYHQHPDTPH